MKNFLCAAFLALALATSSGLNVAQADIARLPPDVVAGIAALGPHLDPQVVVKTFAMMRPLAPATPPASVTVTRDVAYGDDPLQKLDIYMPAKARNLPIAVFVHGGGFVGGDKKDYDNVPTYLSQHGMVAVNANYRLAPKVTWPAETEDVGAIVAFLKKNGAQYGGNPHRIVLIGHSAGANTVASYVLDSSLHPKSGAGVASAVIISLPTGRPQDVSQRDQIYYGSDASLFAKRTPIGHADESKLPLMLAMAEYDPIEIAPVAYDLAGKVCVRDGKCPRFFYVVGHNHISEVASIGSPDDQLGRIIVEFVRASR